ncbi:hypothetical protein TNIN_481951 [Trichonephila inaurata madagascariensis]|uniref:Uncharacterized protein n=1 Tax=Trichonephila inaurata madagascariensis TaxID=2747483 RepID=A0A8X7CKE7_9ARAC|nr:hypothetical protein TNIN_481951 [Trichonephila inaurata madagascariensis]
MTPRNRSDVVEKSVAFDDDDADFPIDEDGVSKKTHISLSTMLNFVSVSATLTSSQQIAIEGSSLGMSPSAMVGMPQLLQQAVQTDDSASNLSKSFHSMIQKMKEMCLLMKRIQGILLRQ